MREVKYTTRFRRDYKRRKRVVYLTSRIQTSQQFVRLTGLDQFAALRRLHGRHGFRIRIKRLERQGLFLRHTPQQQTEGVGHGKPDFLERRSRLILGALIDAGPKNRIGRHWQATSLVT